MIQNAHIESIGMLTRLGSAEDLRRHMRSESTGVQSGIALNGKIPSFRELASRALAECIDGLNVGPNAPLLLASCNGSIRDDSPASWLDAFTAGPFTSGSLWSETSLPVISTSCTSGLHALQVAFSLLDGGERRIIVLAVEALSDSNTRNFETLRVLSNRNFPWQEHTEGFSLGYGAVALSLTSHPSPGSVPVTSAFSSGDRNGLDGLRRVLFPFATSKPDIIIAQGTGPYETDKAELASIGSVFGGSLPVATLVPIFGHTLGVSGILSLAVSSLSLQTKAALKVLPPGTARSIDGRPIADRLAIANRAVVACRAMSGSCVAVGVGDIHPDPGPEKSWGRSRDEEALFHEELRSLSEGSVATRPHDPPDYLFVHFDRPLIPPERARRGKRLLPRAIQEMTPGFAAELVARRWGFAGPAIAIVDGQQSAVGLERLQQALSAAGCRIGTVRVGPTVRLTSADNRKLSYGIA